MKRHDQELAKAFLNIETYIKALEETNNELQEENELLKEEVERFEEGNRELEIEIRILINEMRGM